ncbi:hypothetical protein B0A53_05036 [Rhodotorula sp. CCFEE 5036]|nr:hypothetical protein B0A53_05036 [Rhodotorula sp. CCFEE 5036]
MSQREREDDRNDRTWKRIDDPVNDLESDARSFRLDEDLYGPIRRLDNLLDDRRPRGLGEERKETREERHRGLLLTKEAPGPTLSRAQRARRRQAPGPNRPKHPPSS